MWEKVAKRSHKPFQIYAFGAGADDVMLHGTVDYVFKDVKTASSSWGAKAHFRSEDGVLKMDFYQVFLVSRTLAYRVEAVNGGAESMMYRILVLWLEQSDRH